MSLLPGPPNMPRLSTSLGHLQRLAVQLDQNANRAIVNWEIDNRHPARLPHQRACRVSAPSQPPFLRLPDELIDQIFSYLDAPLDFLDPQPGSEHLFTNWHHIHRSAHWPHTKALALVSRRLALVARPRLHRHMAHLLRRVPCPSPDPTRPVGALATSQFDEARVWITGIENVATRHWIRHVSLSDDGAPAPRGCPSMAPTDMATLLNLLSDNLETLVIKGSAVASLFAALDAEPLARKHTLACLKLSPAECTLAVDWLVLCSQKFAALRRLAIAVDLLVPSTLASASVRLPKTSFSHPVPRYADAWRPETPLKPSQSICLLEEIDLHVAQLNPSAPALAQLLALHGRQLRMLSLGGSHDYFADHSNTHLTLGLMLSHRVLPFLEKLSLALQISVKSSQLAALTSTIDQDVQSSFINSLLDIQPPRLRTLAITLSALISEPRLADVDWVQAHSRLYKLPLLTTFWQSPLFNAPQLYTCIVRTLPTVLKGLGSLAFAAPLNLEGHVSPNDKPASLTRLGVHLDLEEYKVYDNERRNARRFLQVVADVAGVGGVAADGGGVGHGSQQAGGAPAPPSNVAEEFQSILETSHTQLPEPNQVGAMLVPAGDNGVGPENLVSPGGPFGAGSIAADATDVFVGPGVAADAEVGFRELHEIMPRIITGVGLGGQAGAVFATTGGGEAPHGIRINFRVQQTSINSSQFQRRINELAEDYNSKFEAKPSTIELKTWCKNHQVKWISFNGSQIRDNGIDLFEEF